MHDHIAKLVLLPASILIYTLPVQAAVESHRSRNSFDCSVHEETSSCLQMAGSKSALTAIGFLSLLICCHGQWDFASSCSAEIKVDQVFASNVTGNYIGMLDIVSCRLNTFRPKRAVSTALPDYHNVNFASCMAILLDAADFLFCLLHI